MEESRWRKRLLRGPIRWPKREREEHRHYMEEVWKTEDFRMKIGTVRAVERRNGKI